MRRLPTSNPRDGVIDHDEWRLAVERNHSLIEFDARDFNVVDDGIGGKLVGLRSNAADELPRDFEVLEVSAASVTIAGGTIDVGAATPVSVLNTTLTLTDSISDVGWEYSYATGLLTIIDFGATYAPDPMYIRRRLWRFEVEDGVAVLARDLTLSSSLPANFGSYTA